MRTVDVGRQYLMQRREGSRERELIKRKVSVQLPSSVNVCKYVPPVQARSEFRWPLYFFPFPFFFFSHPVFLLALVVFFSLQTSHNIYMLVIHTGIPAVYWLLHLRDLASLDPWASPLWLSNGGLGT